MPPIHVHVPSSLASTNFRKLLVVVKQTAYEEYSQLRLRGKAPKALRWKRLEQRYKAHKDTTLGLRQILKRHNVEFECINRVDLDRQHLADVDLVVSVGGDGTALSAAHFLDFGTIPLLGINSDPTTESDRDCRTKHDERRSHGALCMCTSQNMSEALAEVLEGGGKLEQRTRIGCTVKSTFSETKLVPALNDLLIAHPSPASVSRFRMGWLEEAPPDVSIVSSAGSIVSSNGEELPTVPTVTRFNGKTYKLTPSLNVWSSGLWVSTATGSTAAISNAGGKPCSSMTDTSLQYLIREHMIETTGSNGTNEEINKQKKLAEGMQAGLLGENERLFLRWNSRSGNVFIDGPNVVHGLELGDEIVVDAKAPPLSLYVRNTGDGKR